MVMSLLSSSQRVVMVGFMSCVTLGRAALTLRALRYSASARTAVLTALDWASLMTGMLGIAVLKLVATDWLSPWRLVPTPEAAASRSLEGLPEVRSTRVSA